MKIKKSQIEQIKEVLKAENGHSANHIRVEITKNIAPELFKETKLEVGKWYHHGKCNSIMPYNGGKKTYGFFNGSFGDSWAFSNKDTATPATDKEVETALINEAEKRGFKDGVTVKSLFHKNSPRLTIKGSQFSFINNLKLHINGSTSLMPVLFLKGKWATIIETITKEEAEKELGKTILN